MKTNDILHRVLVPGIALGLVAATAPFVEPATAAPTAPKVVVHEPADCPAGDGCFICDPSKREEGRLWCGNHTRYEDRCWKCHPELKEEGRLYCGKHGVYEDECYLCHPELKSKSSSGDDSEPATGEGKPAKATGEKKGLMCREHGMYESECAICHPELAAGLKPGESLKIRVSSSDTLADIGVDTTKPDSAAAEFAVEAYCTVDYNQNEVARITPLAAGIVRDIRAVPGQKVEAGTALATLHSPDLAEAKGRFLSAAAAKKQASLELERENRLAAERISAEAERERAEAAQATAAAEFAAARQHLLDLGLAESEVDRLANEGVPHSQLALKAPFAGTVVERDAAVGERKTPGDAMFVLADLSTMWLELSVPARRAARLAEGLTVIARFDALPDVNIRGKLIWVASAVDPETRRIRARALVTDPPRGLRKDLYGQARIRTAAPEKSLTVPTGSVQEINGMPFVFVRREPDLYAATRVTLSPASAGPDRTVIAGGLGAEDRIVNRGSYIMRSEFLKSRLGAGCVKE